MLSAADALPDAQVTQRLLLLHAYITNSCYIRHLRSQQRFEKKVETAPIRITL
jgi:hypothetical protein